MAAKVPIFFIRFEDLVASPQEELSKLFAFLLDVDSVEGTIVEQRIIELAEAGNEKNTVYDVKKDSKRFNKSSHMYTEEQMKLLMEELKDFNYYFGYADHTDKDDTMTTFLRYSDKDGSVGHDKELLK